MTVEGSQTASGSPRLDCVDALRGAVMVLMALDHSRDFFSPTAWTINPTDLTQTTPGLFVTRWITHFCAPVFVFLAGASVFFSANRTAARAAASWKLLRRGLWLVVLELTVIRFGFFFSIDLHFVLVQVIWVIGWSMVAMAALIHLPTVAVGAMGLAVMMGHNALDALTPGHFGRLDWAWTVLHEGGFLKPSQGVQVLVVYPLLPWMGVMAGGYAFGSLLNYGSTGRKRLVTLGLSCCALFFALRSPNLYGDPRPWAGQATNLLTVFSFVNCEKYPPSLLFLLMTLGPAIAGLGALPVRTRGWMAPLVTFGRVPMFFYILHFYLLHIMAVAVIWLAHGYPAWLFGGVIDGDAAAPAVLQSKWGHNLPMCYAAWITAVLFLYPPCRWFAGVKRRSRSRWLSYL